MAHQISIAFRYCIMYYLNTAQQDAHLGVGYRRIHQLIREGINGSTIIYNNRNANNLWANHGRLKRTILITTI